MSTAKKTLSVFLCILTMFSLFAFSAAAMPPEAGEKTPADLILIMKETLPIAKFYTKESWDAYKPAHKDALDALFNYKRNMDEFPAVYDAYVAAKDQLVPVEDHPDSGVYELLTFLYNVFLNLVDMFFLNDLLNI